MRATIFSILSFLVLTSTAHANSKKTDFFTVGIIQKVCANEECQGYSLIQNIQIEMKEKEGQPNSYFGEAVFNYEVEGVHFTSKVQISESTFNGNSQMNFYLITNEDGNLNQLGSAEVVIQSIQNLNPSALYSAPITHGIRQFNPILMIGPSPASIKNKIEKMENWRNSLKS